MSFYKTKKFRALQDKWDKKLKESGFKDAESRKDKGEALLIYWDSFHFQKLYDPAYFQSKKHYYEIAQDFYNNNQFDNKTDKEVWALHLEGLGVRVISKKLGVKIWQVHEIVIKLKKMMYYGR